MPKRKSKLRSAEANAVRTRISENPVSIERETPIKRGLDTEVVLVDIDFVKWSVKKCALERRWLPISRLRGKQSSFKDMICVNVAEKLMKVFVNWINGSVQLNGWNYENLRALVSACKRYCLPIVQNEAENMLNGTSRCLEARTCVEQMNLAFNNSRFCDVTFVTKVGTKCYANSVIVESQWTTIAELQKMARVHEDHAIQLDVSNNVMMIILNWIYFENASIDTISKTQLMALKKACVKYHLLSLGREVEQRIKLVNEQRKPLDCITDKLVQQSNSMVKITKSEDKTTKCSDKKQNPSSKMVTESKRDLPTNNVRRRRNERATNLGAAISRLLDTEIILVDEALNWYLVNKDALEHRWLSITHLRTNHWLGKGVIRVKVWHKQLQVFVKWINSTDLELNRWTDKDLRGLVVVCKRYCLPGLQNMVESQLNGSSQVLSELNTSAQQMNLAFNNQHYCDVTFLTKCGNKLYANSVIVESQWMTMAMLERIAEVRDDRVICLDVKASDLMIIMRWIYFKEARIGTLNHAQLKPFKAACFKYRLVNLGHKVEDRLKSLYERKNLLKFAEDHLVEQFSLMAEIEKDRCRAEDLVAYHHGTELLSRRTFEHCQLCRKECSKLTLSTSMPGVNKRVTIAGPSKRSRHVMLSEFLRPESCNRAMTKKKKQKTAELLENKAVAEISPPVISKRAKKKEKQRVSKVQV